MSAKAKAKAAKAKPGTSFGVQDDPVLTQPGPERDALLASAKRAGSKVIRYNVTYSGTNGGTDLSKVTELAAAAKKYGMALQPTLMADPGYTAAPGKLSNAHQDPKDWAAFAKNVASGLRGKVKRVEIGNEPNLKVFGPDHGGNARDAGRQYRQGYNAAYDAVKKVNPKMQVLLAGSLGQYDNAGEFDKGLFGGKTVHADGYSTHGYGLDQAKLQAVQDQLGKLKRGGHLQTGHGGQAGLYLTENGIATKDQPNDTLRARALANQYNAAQNVGAKQYLAYQLTSKAGTPGTPGTEDTYDVPGMPGTPDKPGATWDTHTDLNLLPRNMRRRRPKKRR